MRGSSVAERVPLGDSSVNWNCEGGQAWKQVSWWLGKQLVCWACMLEVVVWGLPGVHAWEKQPCPASWPNSYCSYDLRPLPWETWRQDGKWMSPYPFDVSSPGFWFLVGWDIPEGSASRGLGSEGPEAQASGWSFSATCAQLWGLCSNTHCNSVLHCFETSLVI